MNNDSGSIAAALEYGSKNSGGSFTIISCHRYLYPKSTNNQCAWILIPMLGATQIPPKVLNIWNTLLMNMLPWGRGAPTTTLMKELWAG